MFKRNQQTRFMVLRNWPIGGPSSVRPKFGKALKTVDATHPNEEVRMGRHGHPELGQCITLQLCRFTLSMVDFGG
jgi:hypothetical protein